MKISFKKSKIQPGVTPIENLFLDLYLPIVSEIDLKVYLYLYKRMYGAYSNDLTFEMIAKDLHFSDVQVKNSFKFWKNNSVMDYKENDFGEIVEVEFYNFYASYSGTLSIAEEKEEKEKEIEKPLIDTGEYISKIENLIGLSLKPYEIESLMNHIEETSHSWGLIYRAYLLADSKGRSKSTNYIIGILRTWKRDHNIITEKDLDVYLSKKDTKKIFPRKNLKKYVEKKHIFKNDENKKDLDLDDSIKDLFE